MGEGLTPEPTDQSTPEPAGTPAEPATPVLSVPDRVDPLDPGPLDIEEVIYW